MLRLSSLCVLAVAALIGLPAPAAARVLTLSPQDESAAVVRDAASGSSSVNTLVSPEGRLLVAVGAVAADAGRDLVYVTVNSDPAGSAAGSPGAIRALAYGSTPAPPGALNAPVGRYFSSLVYDPALARLVGVVSDPTGVAAASVFTATTNAGTSFGVPAYVNTVTGCCRFTSGIAAWRAGTQELFLIGRRNGDTDDQLLRFDVGVSGPAMPDAYPIAGGDRVAALAVDASTGTLYAIARSVLDFSYLASVTWSAPGSPASLSAIGSAPSGCCYLAAGPATIDGAAGARALFALTRDTDSPGTMRLSRFDFASGNPVVVNPAMHGYGLWSDPVATLDRIFADGFD
ncbi:MAG: hypothetical protein ABI082_09310 [Dokdonella sp.]